ncbi:hypothetical protein ACFQY4_15435 [Catellatospora bangladeshensis]|uniref:hypothetical protein n=1 Tax=Catellatospora bangladeshensis TaxID=310355 RepID=UPI001941A6FE|nr:hypothetical protein [Catellatospora bangladeshensis]
MGYAVWPSGRLHLPESEDGAAVAAVLADWAARGRPLEPETADPTLADIVWAAAGALTRDGDWIEFAFDEEGDPKWSDSATAFYVAIAPFVRKGTVHFDGEDGSHWSYTYTDGGITQHGWNGWDASVEPFGEAQDGPVEPDPPSSLTGPLLRLLAGAAVVAGAAMLVAKLF